MTDKAGSVLAKVSVPFQEYPKHLGNNVIVTSKEAEDKFLGVKAVDSDQYVFKKSCPKCGTQWASNDAALPCPVCSVPSAADLDAVAKEQKAAEATAKPKKKSWGG